MTRVVVLPHQDICPEGALVEAEQGMSLCEALLDAGLAIEHACEMSCACTTCHVIVRAKCNLLRSPPDNNLTFLFCSLPEKLKRLK